MKKALSLMFLLFIVKYSLTLCQNIVITGTIQSKKTGLNIPFATCFDSISKIGITCDENGYFKMILNNTRFSIEISHVSYIPKRISFPLIKDTSIIVNLEDREINEVLIFANETPLHEQTLAGKISISPKTINNLPSFLGEPDIIKVSTYLPGISGGKEGYSSLHVRGGERGQNLVLLDNVPIYNINHVGGLVSIFNSNIIENVDVYKGGFPSVYGGKLSSILDVQTKNGNFKENHGKFSIGLLSSSFFFEGPIKKDTTSFVFAGRTSYFDLISFLINTKKHSIHYTFFDLNGKISHKLNSKDKITLSFYSGHDVNRFKDIYGSTPSDYSDQLQINENGIKMHNTTISLKYRKTLFSNLILKSSAYYVGYQNNSYLNNSTSTFSNTTSTILNQKSIVYDLSLNVIFDYYVNNRNIIRSGVSSIYHKIAPSIITTEFRDKLSENNTINTLGSDNKLNIYDIAFFLENEFKIRSNINLNAGIRSIQYIKNDISYFKTEPRISFRCLITPALSYKLNYTRMNQFVNVLVNNYLGLEREFWVVSSAGIEPQKSDQFSKGIYGSFFSNHIEFGIEGYYKIMNNMLYYHSQSEENEYIGDWEQNVKTNGKGQCYGLEILLKSETKKINSIFSYTLSNTNREFPGINNGKPFPFDFDKKHDVTLLFQYLINKTYSIGFNFVYNSGTPVTLPIGYSPTNKYFYGYYIYEGLNNQHLPDYHRLDIFYKKNWIKNNGNSHYLSINIYNVYARKNPVYAFYKNNKLYQKSLFSIIPTFNYGFNF